MAAAAKLASILLVLSLAFIATTATAHRSPPSNETLLVKKCTEALGPNGSDLVAFCARDFLGHRAAFLATCDRRKTVTVVIKEAYKRAKAVEDLGKKIDNEKSLSEKELQNLKICWRLMSKVVSKIGNFFRNAAVEMPSSDPRKEFQGMWHSEEGQCDFFAAGRQSGVWSELQVKANETLRAELVMMAFVGQRYN